MNTKLTLRLDEHLIGQAKKEARKRGTSVSKMVANYFRGISSHKKPDGPLPPITTSLLGSLRGSKKGREDYRRHLEEKYL
ncbi:MAG: DUF6364 family protein [Chthoniobacteraceae bacterium]